MANPISKSTALLIVFFLLAIVVARQPSSTEASRVIKPAAAVDDLLFTLLAAKGMVSPAAAAAGARNDEYRSMNMSVKCLRSAFDFMTCLVYMADERMAAPPAACCYGFKTIVAWPPCACQIISITAGMDEGTPVYVPHFLALRDKCGIPVPHKPGPGCDAYISPPQPSPVPAPASPAPSPSSGVSP